MWSKNDYDWLGHGSYFWQNDPERALDFAKESMTRKTSNIKKPAVVGAIIDLGYCLDLIDSNCLNELKRSYEALILLNKLSGKKGELKPLPVNTKLFRKLDCAVIETLYSINKIIGAPEYNSVRGVFWEGDRLYPGAGFADKNHIQICIRNNNCIKGYFLPKKIDNRFPNP